MGALFSLATIKTRTNEYYEVSQTDMCKRQKVSSSLEDKNTRLIPSLPDEISFQILARLPRICYLTIKLVSHGWKVAVTSSEIFHLRKELGKTEEWLYVLLKSDNDKLVWHALDPFSKKWQRLPPMSSGANESKQSLSGLWMWNMMGSTIRIADLIKGWLGRKDTLSLMPFCGSAIGAVDGCLYILGGFSKASATRCVWRYDPCMNVWCEVSSMNACRAYCKVGLLKNKLYVVGGVSRGRRGLTPLQSAEVFDPLTGTWTEMPSMPFSRAQVLPTAFMADLLKPIATGMTSYQGKLCVPQSLYTWPFFVDAGGEMYDPETNAWSDMPAGMGEGWPARQAGTKLSVVVKGDLYAMDASGSLDSGKIKMYDSKEDVWKVIIGKVPIHDLTDSESPYLLAGFLGKLHVITKDANHEVTVLQADLQKQTDPVTSEAGEVWRVIASKDFGHAELVSCQVLDI